MHDLSVTVIQDVQHWHNPPANRAMYEAHINAIVNTDLIVLPEMFSSGFSMSPQDCHETMDGDTIAWMKSVAKNKAAVLAGSLAIKLSDDRFVNRFIWAQPDGEINFYDKRHLFRFEGEHHHFNSGNQRVVMKLNQWRIALFVCYDLRFPVWNRNRNDYDVAIYVANWPSSRQHAWDTLLAARAIENQAYVVGVNRIGENGLGLAYSGGTVIHDFLGQPLVNCLDQQRTETVTLSKQALVDSRKKFQASLDADNFTIID